MSKFRGIKGQLVQLEFHDHSIETQGDDEPMRFIIWGRVQSVTDKLIIIRQWELQNGSAEDKKSNNEVAKILWKTVIDIKFIQLLKDLPIEEH